jgi:GDP-L-fucose synthase
MIDDIRPDCVIHLAANVGGLFKNMNQKVEMFEHNMRMNMNVVQACHELDVQHFVGMLSTCIFPDKTSYPINEMMLHEGPPHTSNDAYAYAKRMLDVQCRAYNEQHGRNYKCVVPTNVYGEHDNYNLQNAHVIPALIHRCRLARDKNEPFVVKGTGKPLRQFVYSRDLAAGVLSVLDCLQDVTEGCVIINGGDHEHSIKHVATEIAALYDYSHMISFDDTFSDGQYKKTADGTLFKTLVPNFEFTPLTVGLKRSVDWFEANYPNCRI